jgi:hypothetical protein
MGWVWGCAQCKLACPGLDGWCEALHAEWIDVLQDGNMLRDGDMVEYEEAWDDRKGKYMADAVTGGCRDEDYDGRGGRGGGRDYGRDYDRYDDRRLVVT